MDEVKSLGRQMSEGGGKKFSADCEREEDFEQVGALTDFGFFQVWFCFKQTNKNTKTFSAKK